MKILTLPEIHHVLKHYADMANAKGGFTTDQSAEMKYALDCLADAAMKANEAQEAAKQAAEKETANKLQLLAEMQAAANAQPLKKEK